MPEVYYATVIPENKMVFRTFHRERLQLSLFDPLERTLSFLPSAIPFNMGNVLNIFICQFAISWLYLLIEVLQGFLVQLYVSLLKS
jgi:hypothetical protein